VAKRIDHPTRPICICGSLVAKNHKRKDGTYGWSTQCSHCSPSRHPYRKYKKKYCEECGFVAIHKVQLDVDHIDGNHKNNDISNLRTLCRNCHSLKTIMNKDHLHDKNI